MARKKQSPKDMKKPSPTPTEARQRETPAVLKDQIKQTRLLLRRLEDQLRLVGPTVKTKYPPDLTWKHVTRQCPHCHEFKVVFDHFQVFGSPGKQRTQGWCKTCRSLTSYRNKPRTYVRHGFDPRRDPEPT